MAEAQRSNNMTDACSTCASKSKTNRPSICQCKHCSQSFCFDCMKEHYEQLQSELDGAKDLCNHVKALINEKKQWIIDETTKSKNQIDRWLEIYIRNLKTEVESLKEKMEKNQKETQRFFDKFEADLATYAEVCKANDIFQSNDIREKLENLSKRILSLQLIRDFDLPSTMPKYIHEFQFSSKPMAPEESKTKSEWTADEDETAESEISNVDSQFSENYFRNRDKFERTSYSIDCMASDGIDIMYSSNEDPQCPRIAFCYLDPADEHYRKEDPSREWHQSRIVDMVWWETIERFLCVTEIGLYSVEYLDERFRILAVVHGRWTDPRIAVNSNFLWVYANPKISVYNSVFQLVKTIEPHFLRSLTLTSFCLTDTTVASAFFRRVEKDKEIVEIRFFNTEMQSIKKISLGKAENSPFIRTDGQYRFFTAIGQQRFFILTTEGKPEVVNLGKQASALAVVNHCSIALTKSRTELELVRC